MSLFTDHCIRVTLPYEDCSGIIQKWVSRCNKAIVYEHPRDEDVTKTHVHMALIGCDVKAEALKRMWPEAPGKGNEFWSFAPPKSLDQYLVYMTKGTLRPKLVKNFSPADLEKHVSSWVEPKLGNDKKDASPVDYYIDKVVSRFIIDGQFDYSDYHRLGNDLFTDVRKATMSVFWGEKRQVPHATQYKTVASTAYLRIMEFAGRLDDGFQVIMEKWY